MDKFKEAIKISEYIAKNCNSQRTYPHIRTQVINHSASCFFNNRNGKQLTTPNIMRFKKYKQNLKKEGNKIISYNTIVAEIRGQNLCQLTNKDPEMLKGKENWSKSTQRHINYAAQELKLTLIKTQ